MPIRRISIESYCRTRGTSISVSVQMWGNEKETPMNSFVLNFQSKCHSPIWNVRKLEGIRCMRTMDPWPHCRDTGRSPRIREIVAVDWLWRDQCQNRVKLFSLPLSFVCHAYDAMSIHRCPGFRCKNRVHFNRNHFWMRFCVCVFMGIWMNKPNCEWHQTEGC